MLAADDNNDGPSRFHDVTRWWGRLEATARIAPESMPHIDATLLSRKGAWRNIEFGATLTVEFLLDEYESDPSVWRGRVKSATGHFHHYVFSHMPMLRGDGTRENPNYRTGYTQFEAWADASGVMDFSGNPEVRLEFHRQRGWSVRMSSGKLPAETRSRIFKRAPRLSEQSVNHDMIIDTDNLTEDSFEASAFGLGSTQTIPYPEKGLQLSARNLQTRATYPFSNGYLTTPDIIWDYSIHLEPASADELRLEIEDTPAYRDWRPSAASDGSAGTPVDITARLVTADGKTPRIRVRQFEWTLEDTSREPGIAMNFPREAPDDGRPDLELQATGDLSELSDRNQRLVRTVREGFSDQVKVVPFDWGGWSTLRVTAVLVDGRRVEGTLKGTKETGLRLPKRSPGSKIADAWKKQTGASGSDSADNENTPVGDATRGDGFTLYQEYRGFYEAGAHIEGDPKRKDFFVLLVNCGIAIPGVQKFARVTGLAVRYQFDFAEFPLSRIMNGNRKSGAHIADQHGVSVQVEATQPKGVSEAYGGPGSPKKIIGVALRSDAATTDSASLKVTVAHELGHCVNIWHHGEADDEVEWEVKHGGIWERKVGAAGPGTIIVVMDESGNNQTEVWKNIVANSENGILTQWRGRDQGQHSGFDNCFMRYGCSDTYIYRTIPIWRVAIFDEPPGHALCTNAAGSGVNNPNRDPIDRYGAAARGRGDCLHQIHVTDAVEAPTR